MDQKENYIPSTFTLADSDNSHIDEMAALLQSGRSYALRQIIREHKAWSEIARAKNAAGSIATPIPQ